MELRRVILRCSWLLTLALFVSHEIHAAARDLPPKPGNSARLTELQACAGAWPAQRTGEAGCWVRFADSLCIPRAEWLAWLASPGPLCGQWVGRWKLYSPPLNEPVNPAGGSARSHLKETRRIFQVTSLPAGKASRFELLRGYLERARERLDDWLAPTDETGILRELLTGTRIPGGALELLSVLGLIHLLVASGIHLHALARSVDLAIQKLTGPWELFPLAWCRLASSVLSAVIWAAGWGLAGARPAMLRPWLVLGLGAAARRLGLSWRAAAPLMIALALELGLGFWRGKGLDLSSCVYALAYGGGLLSRSAWGMALGSWGTALGAWLSVVLLLAWQGGTVALATPVLSLLSLPIFAGVLYPLLLAASALLACGLPDAAALLARFCGGVASHSVSSLALAVMKARALWIVGRPALLAGAVLGAAALFATKKSRLGGLALLLLGRSALAGFPSSAQGTPTATRVEQLDVAQGDAALVVTETDTDAEPRFGLIDAGSERALGDRAWLELLARRGARRLDWIALTHLDEDHSGGVKRLGRLIPIGCVVTARAELESSRGQRYKRELESLGLRLTDWSGPCVPFPTLAPLPPSPGRANQNMGAVLVPLQGGGFYLSAGDADLRDEPRIGAWAHERARRIFPPEPRILKISHHGSKTSSNPKFIEAVSPTEAWISVGTGNRYGHPSPGVLERLERSEIPVRRTDETGVLCAGRCAGWDR